MASFEAILAVVSGLIKLANFMTAMMHDHEQQGIGRTQALADALEQAHKELAMADAAQVEADMAHKDPTDDAFDPAFKRSD